MLRSVAWLRSSTHFTRSQLLSVAVGKISADVIAKVNTSLSCRLVNVDDGTNVEFPGSEPLAK